MKTGTTLLTGVTAHPAPSLILYYEDGSRRFLDFRELLTQDPELKPLRDYALFSRARVDSQGAVVWDVAETRTITLSPERCHTLSRRLFTPTEDPVNYETLVVDLNLEDYYKASQVAAEYGLTFEEAAVMWIEELVRKAEADIP